MWICKSNLITRTFDITNGTKENWNFRPLLIMAAKQANKPPNQANQPTQKRVHERDYSSSILLSKMTIDLLAIIARKE
jgi:hypothetical protein